MFLSDLDVDVLFLLVIGTYFPIMKLMNHFSVVCVQSFVGEDILGNCMEGFYLCRQLLKQ